MILLLVDMVFLLWIISAGGCFTGTTNGCFIRSPNFRNNYPKCKDKTYNTQATVMHNVDDYACHTPPYIPKARGARDYGITLWDDGLVPYEFTKNCMNPTSSFLRHQRNSAGYLHKLLPRTAQSAYSRSRWEARHTRG
eukprot:TRINITY_DN6387_c0_g1_i1.p1 TRINITY_DN6387_c0_g1~~TRINITY_DN6387_c0_g1_i1.p1  ORF type:complete len:138 (-),score=6.81 TRINITY_DN6387_c0_g1_i1:2-415(-)